MSKEEEHRKRLDQSNEFFQEALKDLEKIHLKDEAFELQVISYFHDYWSVIRGNAVKFLTKVVSRLSQEQINFFFGEFKKSFIDEGRHWQDIHGSFQGFVALIPVLDDASLDEISDLCFQNIGHVRNPIRESCKDCLVKICNKSKHAKLLLIKILQIIKENSSYHLIDDEYETLRLDGFLHCITELVPLLDVVLFQSNNFDSPRDSPQLFRSENTEPNLSLKEFINIIKSSMLHNASTVRQKAGSIISKLFHSFLMKKSTKNSSSFATLSASLDEFHNYSSPPPVKSPRLLNKRQLSFMVNEELNDTINYIIDHLLIQILNIHSLEYWNGHEVCLIICEELIRDFLNIFFIFYKNISFSQSIRNIRENPILAEFLLSLPILEINKLLHFLHDELVILLCHPRFEVRRMILQLIPTAIRGKIVIDALLSDYEALTLENSSTNSSPALSIRARSITEDDSYEKHLKRASLNRHFLPMVEMIWISSMIKENRHFQEVLTNFSNSNVNNNSSSSSSSSSSQTFNGNLWSNEVHGRLLEVELRQEFHQNLIEIMKNKSSQFFILKALLINDQYILELIQHYLMKMDQNHRISPETVVPNNSNTSSCGTSRPNSIRKLNLDLSASEMLNNNSNTNTSTSTNNNNVTMNMNEIVTTEEINASDLMISEKYISMDFVEFYCLVECFLHNIKERSYSELELEEIYPPSHNIALIITNPYQSPTFQSQRKHFNHHQAAEETNNNRVASPINSIWLISQAMRLLEQIKRHGLAWISILSYLQFATHQKNNNNVNANANGYGSIHATPRHFPVQSSLINNTTGSFSTTTGNTPDSLLSSISHFPTEWSLQLLDVFFQEKTESCKHKNSFLILKYWKMGYEMSGIRLLPTLTDPATNPIIYADEHVLSRSFDELDQTQNDHHHPRMDSNGNLIGNPPEPSITLLPSIQEDDSLSMKLTISGKNNYPTTSGPNSLCISSAGLSPIGLETPSKSGKFGSGGGGGAGGFYANSLASPGVLPLASPNKLGVGSNLPVISTINSFQSMNRWNCEAIAPLLFSFSCHVTNMEMVLLLSAVISEWILFNYIDPLWLDNRRYIKRVLFESLPNFLLTITKQLSFHKYQNEYRLLIFHMISMLMEIFQMILTKGNNNNNNNNNSGSNSNANVNMDLKYLQPMVKSCISMVQMLFDFTPMVWNDLNQSYSLFSPSSTTSSSFTSAATLSFPSAINSLRLDEIRLAVNESESLLAFNGGGIAGGGIEGEKQQIQEFLEKTKRVISSFQQYFSSQQQQQQQLQQSSASSASSPQQKDLPPAPLSQQEEEEEQGEQGGGGEDEDEFSDWDEDEESSIPENVTVSNQFMALNSMVADLDYLQKQLEIWAHRLDLVSNHHKE